VVIARRLDVALVTGDLRLTQAQGSGPPEQVEAGERPTAQVLGDPGLDEAAERQLPRRRAQAVEEQRPRGERDRRHDREREVDCAADRRTARTPTAAGAGR